MANTKEQREKKTNRLLEALGEMKPGQIMTPTELSDKSHIHWKTVNSYLEAHKSFKDADIIILMDTDKKIRFIQKTEGEDKELKDTLESIKKELGQIKKQLRKK